MCEENNITERKRAEEALAEAEEKYRSLVEESLVGVYLIQDGHFAYVNPRMAEIFGYTQDELIGKLPVMNAVAPEDRQTVAENLQKRLTGELKSLHYSFTGLRKDGSRVDIEVLGSITTFRGKPAVIGSLLDITQRKRMIEELLERRERELQIQAEAERTKRVFYRETILSVTNGKLDICDEPDLEPYINGARMVMDTRSAADVSSARHEVSRLCRQSDVDDAELDAFLLGVGEAVTNAVKHGNGGRVYAGIEEGRAWVGVEDKGRGIESLILPRAVLLRGFSTKPSLGLGYSIMLDVADRILLKTDRNGTTVVLEKDLAGRRPELSAASLPDTWENVPS